MCRLGVLNLSRWILRGIGFSFVLVLPHSVWAIELPGFLSNLPEIRYGGALGSTVRTERQAGLDRSWEFVSTTKVAVNSYVWQPWFLQVDGKFDNLQSRWFQNNKRGEHRRTVNGGGIEFIGLPNSSFPTKLSYSYKDGRVGKKGARAKHVNDEIKLSTNIFWSPTLFAAGGYSWFHDEDDRGGRSYSSSYNANVDQTIGAHRFKYSSSYQNQFFRNNFAGGYQTVDDVDLGVKHRVILFDNLRINNSFSTGVNKSKEGLLKLEDKSASFNSRFGWSPDKPYRVNGNVLVSGSKETTEGIEGGFAGAIATQETDAAIGLTGIYYVTPALQLDATWDASFGRESEDVNAVSLTNSDVVQLKEREQTFATSADITARYNFRTRNFFNFGWSGNVQGSVSAVTNNSSSLVDREEIRFTHSTRRQFSFEDFPNLMFSASQSASLSRVSAFREYLAPITTSFNLAITKRTHDYDVRLSGSFVDQRLMIGAERTSQQYLKLGVDGNYIHSSGTRLRAALNWSLSRKAKLFDKDAIWAADTGVALTAEKEHLFGVKNLTGKTTLNLTSNSLLPLTWNGEVIHWGDELSYSRSLSTNLSYAIGKVRATLSSNLHNDDTRRWDDRTVLTVLRRF